MICYTNCFIIKFKDEVSKEIRFIPMIEKKTKTNPSGEWITVLSGLGKDNASFSQNTLIVGEDSCFETLKTYFEGEFKSEDLYCGSLAREVIFRDTDEKDKTYSKPALPEDIALWVLGHVSEAIDYDDISRLGYPLLVRKVSAEVGREKRILNSEELNHAIAKLSNDDALTFRFSRSDVPTNFQEQFYNRVYIAKETFYVIDMTPEKKGLRKRYFFSKNGFKKNAIGVKNPRNAIRFATEESAINAALDYVQVFEANGFEICTINDTIPSDIPIHRNTESEYWIDNWKQ